MTVEVQYRLPEPRAASDWQVKMARQIEKNRGFAIENIGRILNGRTLTVRVDTSLPSNAVENMLSDIEDHIPSDSTHVETREI